MAVRGRKEPRIGAFFDMDKTLIAENSGALLMKWRYERAELPSSELVSGATKFVVKPLAARLGFKHILYTRLEVENGRLTGRVIDPICFEEGKIYWLQQLVEKEEIDLAKSWFYTDSVTDLPLLELVGHPVVVNPDPRLYRAASRRHWPVRFFTPPGELRE
jgi:phosphoserine phosphatase